MFFLHFLVMTSTLFCLSRIHKFLHCLEDFVGSSHVFINKMGRVNLEEPVISFVLLEVPVAFLSSLAQSFCVFSSFLYFFFLFFDNK
jgi:hypothetical protein